MENTMVRTIKYLIIAIVGVVLLATVTVASLAYWINPNIFKDDIEKLAAEQGLSLQLKGDLSWQIFPNIQIVVAGANLATIDAPNTTIISFDEAQLSVALMPLLKKDIIVKGVGLDGLQANLLVDEKGVGNWTQIGKQDPNKVSQKLPDENAKPLNLGIEKLQLSNSRLHYQNAQTGQDIELSKLRLSSSNVSLNDKLFPLSFSSDIQFKDAQQSLDTSISFNAKLSVNETLDNFSAVDAELELAVDHSNAQASLAATSTLEFSAQANTKDELKWSLSRLQLSKTQLQYQVKDGITVVIKSLAFNGGVNPGGDPSQLSLSSELEYAAPGQTPINTQLNFKGLVGVDEKLNQINLSDSAISAKIGDDTMSLSTTAKATLSPLDYQASLKLAEFNLRNIAQSRAITLPEMAEANSLSKISLNVDINGNEQQTNISKLNIKLDSSTLTGSAKLPADSKQLTTVVLNIDKINIDHYLPPPAEETNTTQDTAKASSNSDELAIPREMLNSLNVDAKITIGELIASTLPFKNIVLHSTAKQGLSKVAPFKGLIYDSPFNLDAQLDTRSKVASFKVNADSTQLPLGKLLTDLKITEEIAGKSNVKIALASSGNTVTAAKHNLDGNIDLSAQNMRLNNMNIERAFCQLVTRLQQETFDPNNWPLFSDLKDASTKITITKGVAKIETLQAGVTKLALSGQGKVDLNSEAFDVVLNTRLAQADQDAMACKINNEKLLNRDIPIRCQASFGKIDAKSCLPDFRVIEDIAKEKAKNKIEQKAKEAIDKKLGGEKGEAAKQLFNQFFKK
jgi:AsmA protein